MGVVYMWIDPDFPEDTLYVGGTMDFMRRFGKHLQRATRRPGPFHRYVNTAYDDWTQVDMYILEENIPKLELRIRETSWWTKLQPRFGNCAIETPETHLRAQTRWKKNNVEKIRAQQRRYHKKTKKSLTQKKDVGMRRNASERERLNQSFRQSPF